MKMTKVKTAELSGNALDYTVQLALLIKRGMKNIDAAKDAAESWARSGDRAYSTDWAQCGPLIESKKIWLSPPVDDPFEPYGWDAEIYDEYGNDVIGHARACDTALIAACRAIVAAELGDEVEVPEVLLK